MIPAKAFHDSARVAAEKFELSVTIMWALKCRLVIRKSKIVVRNRVGNSKIMPVVG